MTMRTPGGRTWAAGPSRTDIHPVLGPSIITAHHVMHDAWQAQLVQEAHLTHALATGPQTRRRRAHRARVRTCSSAFATRLIQPLMIWQALVVHGERRG